MQWLMKNLSIEDPGKFGEMIRRNCVVMNPGKERKDIKDIQMLL